MKNYGTITCVALSKEGAEYNYIADTAHAVSKAAAQEIADTLNAYGWHKPAGLVWHVHKIDKYSAGYDAATVQKITKYRDNFRVLSGEWMARF